MIFRILIKIKLSVSSTDLDSVSRNSFPGSLVHKESACSAGDLGSMPGSGTSPGEGFSILQYSCLENHMERGT